MADNKLILIVDSPQTDDDKKTAAFPRRRSRRLGRRRLSSKAYLRVFDMGQFANGADSDIHEWIRAYTTPYTVFRLGGDRPIRLVATVEDETLIQRTATWNTDFLSIDNDDWPGTFKDITTDIDDYEIEVTGFDQLDPAKGLWSSTGATDIGVLGTPGVVELRDKWFFSYPVGGVGTRSVKYTMMPSYGATGVTFTFDKTCDLFLVPVAFWGYGDSVYGAGPSTYNFEYDFVQRPLSRQLLGDPGLENFWNNKDNHAGIDSTGRAFLRSYFIDDPEGEIWKVREDGGANPQPIDGDNPVFLPGSSFPEAGDGLGTPTIQVEGVGLFAGKLVGAIRKHLSPGIYEWYYMWASTFWQIPSTAYLEDFEI